MVDRGSYWKWYVVATALHSGLEITVSYCDISESAWLYDFDIVS